MSATAAADERVCGPKIVTGRRGVERMRHVAIALTGVGVVLALTACGSGDSANGGDCNARIKYQGSTYRTHNLVKASAEAEETSLGRGDVVGCDGEAVDQVSVHRVVGVEPDVAIAVTGSEWRGTYVLEGTGPGDWEMIRKSTS
jgi:hypothetical protein